MKGDITRMDCRKRQNTVIPYLVGVGAYLFMYFTFYFSYKHEELDCRELPRFIMLMCAELCYVALMYCCSRNKEFSHIKKQFLMTNLLFAGVLLVANPAFMQYLRDLSYFGTFGFVSLAIVIICGFVLNAEDYKSIIDKKMTATIIAFFAVFLICAFLRKDIFHISCGIPTTCLNLSVTLMPIR